MNALWSAKCAYKSFRLMHKVCFKHLITELLLSIIRIEEFSKVRKVVKGFKDYIYINPCTHTLNKCAYIDFHIQAFKCHTILLLLQSVL